jgi:hypothetical protein
MKRHSPKKFLKHCHQVTACNGALIAILTRFDTVRNFGSASQVSAVAIFVVPVITLAYTVNFVAFCVHSGCLNILRLACLLNFHAVEERFGERKIRKILETFH